MWLCVISEDNVYSEYAGAEAVTHGPGRLHEDRFLSLHRQLLWRPLQGGELTNFSDFCGLCDLTKWEV